MAYTNVRVRENYSRRFSIRFPNEELGAARPFRTTPIYDRLISAGAQMSAAYGLEVPLWFAPDGVRDEFSSRRSTDSAHLAAECAAVRSAVGLIETSGFAKYEVRGEGVARWLDWLMACRIPEPGRMALAPMLKEDGKLVGDFTLSNLARATSSSPGPVIAEDYHMRWFLQHAPQDGSAKVIPLGVDLVGLAIAGPSARDVLASVTHADVSNEAYKFMDIRQLDLGMAPATVGRVSFTGDLGYEIWCKPEFQRYLFDLLMEAGRPHGIRLFGSHALNSLRLEKGYGSWAHEFRPIYSALEADLSRFVALTKEVDFIGKTAAAQEKLAGGRLRRRTFVVDSSNADPIGDEPICHDGVEHGWVTSVGFAHPSGVSVAMGYVAREKADEIAGWEIELLGERLGARLQPRAPFDPDDERMRG